MLRGSKPCRVTSGLQSRTTSYCVTSSRSLRSYPAMRSCSGVAERSAPSAVLFDIDGTLATGSSAHLVALLRAVQEQLGERAELSMLGERPHVGGVDVTGWIDA